MGQSMGMRSRRREWGAFAAVIAMLLVPIAVPAASAAAQPPATSIGSELTDVTVLREFEAPSESALRTTGTLAATVIVVAAVVVGVWWYLARRRRG